MSYIFQLIALFTTFLFASSFVTRVGKYSQLNTKDCGLSFLSDKVNTDCYEWHKDVLPKILDARNATFGEAPWTCHLYTIHVNSTRTLIGTISCSCSVIADQWVLTSAHCFEFSRMPAFINLAEDHAKDKPNKYSSREWYIHPLYTPNMHKITFYLYDIALVKLNERIAVGFGTDSSGHHFYENNICLPEKMERLPQGMKGYAMSAGFGWGQVETDNRNLQIGYLKITHNSDEVKEFKPSINDDQADISLMVRKLDGQKMCHGDSGGPVWQMHMGRAVLVGVLSVADDENTTTGCQMDKFRGFTDYPIFATWVPFHIDWIKNVTGLN